MPPIFTQYKKIIDDFLREYLTQKSTSLGEVNSWGRDLMHRIIPMVTAGKTIRGSLVLVSYCFTQATPSEDAIKLAAAMELMQTALVIHDDIMDHDDLRRGIPTLHKQYESESLAMCAGDILFFMAFELLGAIKTDAVTLGRITRLFGREYEYVGVAQMADVAKSASTSLDILNLYMYKTARYTIALPLMLGATLAGTTKEMLRYLESYGVAVGVLFQITDDLLSLHGDEHITGKPVGNDLREGKKTLAALYHFDETKLKKDIAAYETSAKESLERLPIDQNHKKILSELLAFVLTRKQ